MVPRSQHVGVPGAIWGSWELPAISGHVRDPAGSQGKKGLRAREEPHQTISGTREEPYQARSGIPPGAKKKALQEAKLLRKMAEIVEKHAGTEILVDPTGSFLITAYRRSK